MRFGSLFAGIGGFDLGLERSGMKCAWQVEIDPYAGAVLRRHWPHVRRWADVRTFPDGHPDDWRVDLICAGVPCQPVSVAGKQRGPYDGRWMWGEALRVVADLKPKFFVAENPRAILTHDRGRTFGGIMRALASVGYVCEWHIISACSVGAPHKRERVLLVADADCGGFQRERLKKHSEEQGTRGSISDGCRAGGRRPRQNGSNTDRERLEVRQAEDTERTRTNSGAKSFRTQWWSSEPDVGRVAHGVPSRVDRLRCLGNAIVPQVAEVIGRAIMETAANP